VILVDTSVWIDHLHKSDPRIVGLLGDNLVLMHPWVRGELALGSLVNRAKFLKFLDCLTELRAAKDKDVFHLIESEGLFGRGIGWVDAGLLASCLDRSCSIWTRDRHLAVVACELGVAI
jgi:predicted nucleic acid-binding protein